MLRLSFSLIACGLAVFLLMSAPAKALDEDSDALQFLPSDAPVVLAIDMDEIMSYVGDVGGDWREADQAHFKDMLGSISYMLSSQAAKPDVFTFFSHLDGVQAFTPNMSVDEFPLMVFSAGSERDLRVLSNYTLAYVVENRYQKELDKIVQALLMYRGRTKEDPETGENTYPNTYPDSLDILVEEGYLESMPINPYTGEPIRVIEEGTEGSLGDITYKPCCGGCCGRCSSEAEGSGENEVYRSFKMESYRIGGVLFIEGGWSKTFEPYTDLADRLTKFGHDYRPSNMGFNVEEKAGFTFVARDDACYAFAYGDKFLLFASDVDRLMDAVERYTARSGFQFTPPADFDTSGAFYRDQANMTSYLAEFDTMNMEGAPPEMTQVMRSLIDGMGMNAISMQHTACRLRSGDIESVRRVELSGEASSGLIGSLVNAQPKELMTAEGGPFELIGEVAWANPNEYAHAYMDYVFEFVLPMFMGQMGTEGGDPSEILGMVGLGDIQSMDFGDQMYVLVTSSEDRGDGEYLPGLIALLKNPNPDLPYAAVGLMDSIGFMVPDWPFYQADYGDENAVSWVTDNPELPFTPTIAWNDEWMIKGIWREDVLTARDALENGTLFAPDGMDPANMRVHFHRQELLRGIADVVYEIPEPQVAFVGGVFELLAQLSDPDERLYVEIIKGDGYVESRALFSIDLAENLVPLLPYIARSLEGM